MTTKAVAGLPSPPPEMRFSAHVPLNTALPPAWRWERARWLREKGKYARKGREDEWVRMAVKFQSRLAAAGGTHAAHERLAHEMPGVYWAWYWYDQPGEERRSNRWAVEAYLCAAATPDEIAHRANFHADVVRCYAQLFFDVVGKTKHRLYMLNEVLGRSVHRGLTSREYDLLWKLYGLLRGPVGLDGLIQGTTNDVRPTSDDDVRAVRNQDANDALSVKAWVAARTIPVEYNQEIILAHYCKLQEIEKREKDAGAAGNLILNNINAMLCGSGGFSFGGRPDRSGAPELAAFDSSQAELRTSEQVKLALGVPQDGAALAGMRFPEAPDAKHGS